MPAGLPGDSLFNNQGNPNAGAFVIFDPLSGPKDAPFDAKIINYATGSPAGWDSSLRIPIVTNDDSNISTGALSTGIGIGTQIIGQTPDSQGDTAPESIVRSGFNDNMIPGVQPTYAAPPPIGVVASHTANSCYMYIGGGRMVANGGTTAGDRARPMIPDPYDAGIAICGAGQGGSRDSGANTGFPLTMMTATGNVANGAAIEAGAVNRSGVAMVSGQSSFGSNSSALAAPS